MKNWKFWALVIGLYLVVKMCGGCNGCDDSESNSSDDGKTTTVCARCGFRTSYPQYFLDKPYCSSCIDIVKYEKIDELHKHKLFGE